MKTFLKGSANEFNFNVMSLGWWARMRTTVLQSILKNQSETKLLTISFSWKIRLTNEKEKHLKEWPIKYNGFDGCLHGHWCRLLWQCTFFLIDFYFWQTTMKANIVKQKRRQWFGPKSSIKYTQYFDRFHRLRLKRNLKLNNFLSLLLLSYHSHQPIHSVNLFVTLNHCINNW